MVTCCWVCRRKINTQRETTKKPAITHTNTQHKCILLLFIFMLYCFTSALYPLGMIFPCERHRKKERNDGSFDKIVPLWHIHFIWPLSLCPSFLHLQKRCQLFVCKYRWCGQKTMIVPVSVFGMFRQCLWNRDIFLSSFFFQFNHFNRSLNYYFVSQKKRKFE